MTGRCQNNRLPSLYEHFPNWQAVLHRVCASFPAILVHSIHGHSFTKMKPKMYCIAHNYSFWFGCNTYTPKAKFIFIHGVGSDLQAKYKGLSPTSHIQLLQNQWSPSHSVHKSQLSKSCLYRLERLKDWPFLATNNRHLRNSWRPPTCCMLTHTVCIFWICQVMAPSHLNSFHSPVFMVPKRQNWYFSIKIKKTK